MRLRRFLGRTAAIARKEVFHVARDPFALAIAFGMPLLLLLLFGFAVSFDLDDLRLAVVDADDTPASRRLREAFTSSGTFRHAPSPAGAHETIELADRAFRRGEAAAVLVIPRGYQRESGRDGRPAAQLLVDGADSTVAQTALGYAAAVVQREAQRRVGGLLGAGARDAQAPLRAEVRALFNPSLKSAIFIVPGIVALVLSTVATLLTALSIAREWERGNVEQLFATPVGRLEIIAGKVAPYLVMGLFQVLILLALGAYVFDLPLRGSLALAVLLSMLFLAAMLAQGVLIGTVTRQQQLSVQLAVVTTMLPATLLSGFIFPVVNMPAPLQAISSLVPARYLIEGLRTVLLKGGGPADVAGAALPMALFTLAMIALATRRFRRRLG